MARRNGAPPLEYILELKQEADTQAGELRKRWETLRQIRSGTYKIEIPPQYAETSNPVRTRRVGDLLRRVTSDLTAAFPAVSVPPPRPGPGGQENSTLREKWTNAWLRQMDRAVPLRRPFRRGMDHAAAYGRGVWKLVYTPDSWHDYPTAKRLFSGRAITSLDDDETRHLEAARQEYKQGRIPFAWRAIDPRAWWGFWSEGRLVECIEVSERTVGDLRAGFPGYRGQYGGKLDPALLSEPFVEGSGYQSGRERRIFLEHWTPDHVTYATEQTVLQTIAHGYGRTAYFPFDGLANYTADPGQEPESVAEHILGVEVELDNLLTMRHVWAYIASYAMGALVADADAMQLLGMEAVGEQQTPPEIVFEPGRHKALPPGWKHQWIAPPPVGADLAAMIAYLDGLQRDAVPSVLRGMAQGSDQPGYAINQLITAAKMVYDPISDNASLALEDMVGFGWWLVEHKIGDRGPVYVLGESPKSGDKAGRWLALGAKDVKGYYVNTVNITPRLPNNRIAEGQFAREMVEAKLMPWRIAVEESLRAPSPEEWADEIIVEEELKDPQSPIRQKIRDRALKKAGLLDEIEEAQREAAMAGVPLPPGIEELMAQGQLPPGLPPGAPGGVPGMPGPLAPQPGLGMPLTPPEPTMPGTVGAGGGTGGRAAGQGIQPNTQSLPGGFPMNS